MRVCDCSTWVGDLETNRRTGPKEWMKPAMTACGELRTNFSAPFRGVGMVACDPMVWCGHVLREGWMWHTLF